MGSDRTYLLSKQLYPTPNQKGLGQQSVGRHHAVGWLCCWFVGSNLTDSLLLGLFQVSRNGRKGGTQKKKTFPPIICPASVKQHLNIHVNDQIRHNLSLLCWHTIYGLFVCFFCSHPVLFLVLFILTLWVTTASQDWNEWKEGSQWSWVLSSPHPLLSSPGKKKKKNTWIYCWLGACCKSSLAEQNFFSQLQSSPILA